MAEHDTDNDFEEIAKTAFSLAHASQHTLKLIQEALDTEEKGDALVEVARDAHIAQLQMARITRICDDTFKSTYEQFTLIASIIAGL